MCYEYHDFEARYRKETLVVHDELDLPAGVVKLKLGGACETCAMSTMTLKQGIESKLMHEIPDVVGVVQVL